MVERYSTDGTGGSSLMRRMGKLAINAVARSLLSKENSNPSVSIST
jgi:hypothetical protein